MGCEKNRLMVINSIKKNFLNSNGNGFDKDKLIAEIGVQFGVRKVKAEEYIQLLLDAGFIERLGNELFLKIEEDKKEENAEITADFKEAGI